MSKHLDVIKVFVLIAFTLVLMFISWYMLIAIAAILIIYYISKVMVTIKNLAKEETL